MKRLEIFENLLDSSLFLDSIAFVFRYDRWDKIFFVNVKDKTSNQLEEKFLVFIGCKKLAFNTHAFNPRHLGIKQVGEHFCAEYFESDVVQMRIEFDNFAIWTQGEFDKYDLDWHIKLGDEGRYGTRKPITSLSDIIA
ncbi:MAG: hypothetical protein HC857_02190 [Synechococcales cyanobacterium RU_4_20]|nr:hypothetical protein [Synechococcales cyanobacterium RU_4_20]